MARPALRSRFIHDSSYLHLKASPFWNDSNNWIAIFTFTFPISILVLMFGISFRCTQKVITKRTAFKVVTNVNHQQHRCSEFTAVNRFLSQIQNIEWYFEKLSFNSSRKPTSNTIGRFDRTNFNHRRRASNKAKWRRKLTWVTFAVVRC